MTRGGLWDTSTFVALLHTKQTPQLNYCQDVCDPETKNTRDAMLTVALLTADCWLQPKSPKITLEPTQLREENHLN